MKLPRVKTIKGEKWKVRMASNLRDDSGNECWGLCAYSKREIFIDKTCPLNMREQVFFHECLHALIHEVCIDLPFEIEEAIVENIERWTFKNYSLKRQR